MRTLRAASVQFNHLPGDKRANLEKVRAFTRQAASQNVELIAFPEMCLTGYWHIRNLGRPEIEELAEPVPDGPLTGELLSLAQDTGMVIGAGLIEKAENGDLYNTYAAAMPDGAVARHRKLHCFISEHLSSGNEYTVFGTPLGCRLGILICYDNNIGENVRMTALQGAEVLLAPHQTGGCRSPDPHCMGLVDRKLWDEREEKPEAIEAEFKGPKGRGWLRRWLPARAHDNGIFVLFSNGVGPDDDEVRTGNAMILDPYGRVLAETWRAADDMVVAELDAELLKSSTGHRWIKTRRPGLYQPLAVPTGLEEDTRKVRFDKKGV